MKKDKNWRKNQHLDPYYQKAKEEGYRSRAAYKLLEIQERDQILKPGMTVVDLGAAPGGWSQVTKHILSHNGQVFAMDILEMPAIAGVEFLQGDFSEMEVLEQLMAMLNGQKVDVVLSDIAPNLSGVKGIDAPRSYLLIEMALDFCSQALKPGGSFLVKVFHGPGFDAFILAMRQIFKQVKTRKPKASKTSSKETYLLGLGFKGQQRE